MRRATLTIALGLAFACYALPQEAPSKTAANEGQQSDGMIWWKIANFAILAAGLGYLIGKNVPPLFRKQSDEIKSALAEAAKIKHEAAAYAIERGGEAGQPAKRNTAAARNGPR